MTLLTRIFRKARPYKHSNQTGRKITILYGSQTGNAEFIAREIHAYLKKKGITTVVASIANYTPANLANEQVALFVISTHGEGEPPDTAKIFYKALQKTEEGTLTGLQYAVCALGDSSYSLFCQTGKDIDLWLKQKGAEPLFGRTDCDIDFRPQALQWIRNVYTSLSGKGIIETSHNTMEDRKWVTAHIACKYQLYRNSYDRDCYHLSFHTKEAGFIYQPGDCIGIMPQNDSSLVNQVLQVFGFTGTELVETFEGAKNIKELLTHGVEISSVTQAILERYAQYTSTSALQELLTDAEKLKHYLHCCDILDMAHDFPAKILPSQLIEVLNPLSPRLYSVTSSLKVSPGAVDIAVRSIKQDYRQRMRNGACSVPLCDRYSVGSTLTFFVRQNNNFRLPLNDSLPIIMIGAGTGIAPFRAFLQERSATGAKGKIWLIAGDRYASQGFIYQNEIETYNKQGLLTKLNVAYSRESTNWHYVQDILHEQGADVVQWLNRDAVVYVCGSLKMSHSVKESFILILQKYMKLDKEEALLCLQTLKAEKRYCEDAY